MSGNLIYGTSFYGKIDKKVDGSYITTAWMNFFGLPIHPIASYRIIPSQEIRDSFLPPSMDLEMAQFVATPVPLHKRQVLRIRTYQLIAIAIIAFFIWNGPK